MSRPLAPTIRKYLEFIRDAGRPVCWTEVTAACSPGLNLFRHLKTRGLVKDLQVYYSGDPNEEYTGPRLAQYVLSDDGLKLLEE